MSWSHAFITSDRFGLKMVNITVANDSCDCASDYVQKSYDYMKDDVAVVLLCQLITLQAQSKC